MKDFDNFIMALISDETLLRLDVHILSMMYYEERAFHFIKATKYNNISFDRKVVENENGKKDSKKTITNLEKEANKKKAQYKAKKT